MRAPAILPRIIVAAVLVTAAGLPAGVLAAPPLSTGAVEVSAAVAHAVSPPMRNLGPTAPSAANLRERPLRLVGPGSSPNQPDGALQTTAGTQIAVQPGGLSFDGVGVCGAGALCYAPPDTNGAVGATQYVQWVNAAFAVFDKTTGTIAAGFPKAGNAIWANLPGGCATNNDGDPIVQYDKIANRWILTQFSITGANGTSIPYLQCVAVSQTSDATGVYNLYAFGYSQFPDYPKLGVWPDAYYVTFNMFTSTFVGPQVCAYDRTSMLAGLAATQQCFQLSNSYGAMLPGDFDGTMAPLIGAPDPVLSLGTNSLNLWRFHVDWAHPARTTLTGPTNITVASFSRACNGSNCVPQPSTSQKLDSLGDRLMYRLAYRRFADGHESLVVNHSVSVGGNLFTSGVSSVRWYELRNVTSGTPTVYQQGTLGVSDGIHRWMGSIAMDQAGDMALGYSASSGSLFPSIRYTGRTLSDPANTMEAETDIQAGTGSQLQNLSRWGDYSAMTVDPVDDCTFWYTSEYLTTNGTWNWRTRIASFKFPGCPGTATQAPAITSANATTFTIGTLGSFTVSATGLPTPSISESPLLPGWVTFIDNHDGTATLSGTPAAGSDPSYVITITAANGVGTNATQSFTLKVNAQSGVPGQPAPPSANAGPGKGVSLAWTAPSNGGNAITGYVLKRYVACGLSTSPVAINPGNVLNYKDTSTSAGTSYCYTVAATNSVGTGQASLPSGTVTPRK